MNMMEKTRHLSLSEEEKAGQQRETYQRRLKGLLQKFADGLLSPDRFQDQLKAMQEQPNYHDKKQIVRQILTYIDPDRDNSHWLELIDVYRPDLREPLQETLADYARRRESHFRAGRQEYLKKLRKNHQIQGSAVVPNLIRDREIRQELMIIQTEFRDKLIIISDQADN